MWVNRQKMYITHVEIIGKFYAHVGLISQKVMLMLKSQSIRLVQQGPWPRLSYCRGLSVMRPQPAPASEATIALYLCLAAVDIIVLTQEIQQC